MSSNNFSEDFDHVGYALSEVRRLYRESLVDSEYQKGYENALKLLSAEWQALDKAVSGGERSEVDKEVEGLVNAVIGGGDGESRISKGSVAAVE